MSNPQDYTVGWICAISTERVAARAFLDEEHAGPEYVQTNDNNDYTLGRVGKHNVVIAVAPDGEYGTQSAAAVARDMMHTFPNVRIGLMVGVAGGVPCCHRQSCQSQPCHKQSCHKQDVRLGDIVVCSPGQGKGGLYQYDYGERVQEQDFQTTGYLNQPPTLLRTAVVGLRDQYETHGHQLERAINGVLEKIPRLRKKYQRPDPKTDRLYLSNIKHPAKDKRDCSEICAQDPSQFVPRGIRTTEDDNPTIHYGLIASGNTLVKDAIIRDAAAEEGILCFEMEAAGLMNHFPCLVIRGVCDYSDSHKNKQWQGYAAMAAAAYSRDLLLRIPQNKVEAEKPFRHAVSEMQNNIKNVQDNIKNIARGQQKQIESKDRRRLSEWLSPLSPYARHYENQKQRVDGTGKWLLEDPTFLEWSTASFPSVLFCSGDPGVGKTILSSLVIDHLQSTSTESTYGVCYIYSDYRDAKSQTEENVLGALLKQVLGCLPDIPPEAWSLFKERRTEHLGFNLSDAKDLFQIASAQFRKIYICLDALDELRGWPKVLAFLRDRPSNIKLFLTGRPYVREIVRDHLKEILEVTIKAKDSDIQHFVEREIGGPNDIEPSAMDDKLRTSIKEKIIESAQGSFLLPVLQIRMILQSLTIRDRELSLRTLPSNLRQAFAGSFVRIQQQPEALSNRAAHILAWIHLAERQLTEDELLCALTVKNGDRRFDVRGVPVRGTLLNCCQGLVVMDHQTSTVRLVHYSLEEYLKWQDEIFNVSFREWHGQIAATCLTFLSFPTPTEGSDEDTDDDTDEDADKESYEGHDYDNGDTDEDKDITEALLKYSALCWGRHLQHYEDTEGFDHVQPAVLDLAYEYLQLGWKTNLKSWDYLSKEMYWLAIDSENQELLPVHVAAFFDLRSVISCLASRGLNIDTTDSLGLTPLSWAAQVGHQATVQFLLEAGATVNWRDRRGRTPLSLSSVGGHQATVQLLLGKGAIVDSRNEQGRTPLSYASEEGHQAIVQLLLDEGAAVNSIDLQGRTPLSYAAEYSSMAVMQLLVEKGAIVDSRDSYERTPLAHASGQGQQEIVQLLLDEGAAVNSIDVQGRTPLSYAAEFGNLPVAELLIEKGALLETRDVDGKTPLSYAAETLFLVEKNTEQIIKLLLEKGAEKDPDLDLDI